MDFATALFHEADDVREEPAFRPFASVSLGASPRRFASRICLASAISSSITCAPR